MTAFTDTTATDLYCKLCATIDMGLVDDFCKAFEEYWETDDMEGIASEAATAFVNDLSKAEKIQSLRNGINDNDPATLDAFAAFNANKYQYPANYLLAVAGHYFHEHVLDAYRNDLTIYALIAAASWVTNERWDNYIIYANNIETAAALADQGATPKIVAYALIG